MKPILIATHGMGSDTEEGFKQQLLNAFQNAYDAYPNFKNRNIEEHIDIKVVEYNSILEEHRQKMAEEGADIAAVLAAIPNQTNVSNIIQNFLGVTTKFGSDKFVYTHVLDVLLYRFTVLGELCRIKVGKEIIKAVEERGSSYVHVLGYSLGTSVMHDTLASAYDEGFDINGVIKALSPTMHKLSSVHLVANVSRVLESFVNVGSSIVRPTTGCTNYFREYRHKFDPFTWVRPFDPPETPPWTPNGYELTRIKRIAQFNTHDITHYIKNPKVHREMLPFFDQSFWPSANAKHHADEAFLNQTILGKYKTVVEKAEDIQISNGDSISAFVKAAMDFKNMIDSLGEDFTKKGDN